MTMVVDFLLFSIVISLIDRAAWDLVLLVLFMMWELRS